MTSEELRKILDAWNIDARQAAKILCLHTSKLSEYLDDVSRTPCAVKYSVEALELLDDETRRQLFERRLRRTAHGA